MCKSKVEIKILDKSGGNGGGGGSSSGGGSNTGGGDYSFWTPVANSTFGTTRINAIVYGNGRLVAGNYYGKMAYADWP